jgi:hypothetical protein
MPKSMPTSRLVVGIKVERAASGPGRQPPRSSVGCFKQ